MKSEFLNIPLGDKPHICKLCHKRFALPCNLKAHFKLHHSQEEAKFEETQPQKPTMQEDKASTFSEHNFNIHNIIPEIYRNMMYEEFQKNFVPFRFPYMFPTFEHNLTFHLNQNLPK